LDSLKTRKPKVDFFGGFEEAAVNNAAAAHLLDELCRDFREPEAMVARLHDLEHKGDQITHRMYESLNGVFIPPLDREDIAAIGTGLDDVMDHIFEAADAMCVYNVAAPTDIARALAVIIVQCTAVMVKQLPNLRSRSAMKRVQEGVVEIHRLENEADALLRQGTMDLFHQRRDPIEVIAWSRIYETMEHVTDDCEEVADVLRGLVIKHA
jgi:predicted phosphate transport protein (TIGR00153 family)